ncbi:hypothetical protein GCM10010123_44600 [Pilimelia anulata]|uniref:Uncharacterized protein n=1 Tax=Pilimelia anulata TaxID=53371 RepID=A0A8J3BHY5_9ACTN|nr:hypothetical protein [Pilimelia anulata]GGK09763.1 hypothetical protein GCM10010123_44600 [Pilimelia anulata]
MAHRPGTVVAPAALALAALSALSWFAWCGWATPPDPATGAVAYAPWQVAGCALTLLALAAAAAWWVRPWLPLAVVPVSFTAAWSVTASAADDSGLWGVGAVLLAAGLVAGTGLVWLVVAVLRRRANVAV